MYTRGLGSSGLRAWAGCALRLGKVCLLPAECVYEAGGNESGGLRVEGLFALGPSPST